MVAILMNITDVFDIQLIDEMGLAIHLSGVSISIDLFLNGRHRYGLRLGPTNDEGQLTLRYGDVEAKQLENLKAEPSAFKTPPDECGPVVRFSVPSQSELDSAVEIATSFNLGVVPSDAEWWARSNNRHLSCQVVDVAGSQGAVNIACSRVS